MPSLDVNMSLELANVLLGFSGVVLSGLIGVIFYGIRQFAGSIKELKDTVSEMRILISVTQEKITGIKSEINKTDFTVEERLKNISSEIYRLDCEVSELKQELEILKVLEKEHHKI